MDRTLIDTYRAEEKELGEMIYKKIEMLTLLSQPTEEFKSIFSEDMFLKPNPKAFFPIMHFLFTTLDMAEFKKRFYWPLVDKRSETNFRTSTVDYLNYLNNKHNLKWTQLKNYIVVMPGGKKFLTFLNDFLDFIAKELIKHKEKLLSDKKHLNDLSFEKTTFLKMKQQNQYLKLNAQNHSKFLEDQTKILKEKIDVIHAQYENIAKILNISGCVLRNQETLDNFVEYFEEFFRKNITEKVDKIIDSEKMISDIAKAIENYQIQKTEIVYDRNKILSSYNSIKLTKGELFSDCDNKMNIEMIIKCFGEIFPEIQNLLDTCHKNSLETLEFEEEELSKLKMNAVQLDHDITKYTKHLSDDLKSNDIINNTPIRFCRMENDITKFIQTPPIVNFYQNNDNFGIKTRLALMDDNFENNLSNGSCIGEFFSFAKNQTILMQQKSAKKKNHSDLSGNINQSKIFDASALLRSLKKVKKSHGKVANQTNINRSALAVKWKEQEKSFYLDDEKTLFAMQKTSEKIKQNSLLQTPLCSHKNHNSKKKLFLDTKNSSCKVKISSEIFQKKNVAVQNVQDTSLNFTKLSTSPSGRLEPLTNVKPNNLPTIFLNDLIINFSNNSQGNEFKEDNSKSYDYKNLSSLILEESESQSDDFLFNISDTILENIPN